MAASDGAGARAHRPTGAALVTRAVDTLLDVAVLALASWTLVYDVALVSHLGADVAAGAWIITLPVCAALALRLTHRDSSATPPNEPAQIAEYSPRHRGLQLQWVAFAAAVALAAAAAILVALLGSGAPWQLAWLAGVGAAVLSLFVTARIARRATEHTDGAQPSPLSDRVAGAASLAALACAAAVACLSLFVVRPDADDVYYVNRASYVAEQGTFPLRDTLFSDQQLPAQEYPPVSSYEPLMGVTARLGHVAAATVTYFLIPPLASFLAVLALWRLLRTWRARSVTVALLVCLLFLLMGGFTNASFGNLFLGRMWQGKVLFLSLAVPLLYVYLADWAERRRPTGLLLLGAAGIGCVGLTSTATFVVPLVALAGLSPLLIRYRLSAFAAGFAATAAYPMGIGLVSHVLGGAAAPATVAGDAGAAATLVKVMGHGAMAALAMLALLVGWAGIRRASAAMASATAAALVIAVLAPGVLGLAARASGAGPVLWRLLWVSPVAPLLGALAAAPLGIRSRVLRVVAALVPVGVAATLVLAGVPLWSSSNGATFTARPAWKVDAQALADARGILAVTRPGDTVLAPIGASAAIAVSTTRVRTVDPRPDYLADFPGEPGFHEPQRILLTSLADGGLAPERQPEVTAALRILNVRIACVVAGDASGAGMLAASGYRRLDTLTTSWCFVLSS